MHHLASTHQKVLKVNCYCIRAKLKGSWLIVNHFPHFLPDSFLMDVYLDIRFHKMSSPTSIFKNKWSRKWINAKSQITPMKDILSFLKKLVILQRLATSGLATKWKRVRRSEVPKSRNPVFWLAHFKWDRSDTYCQMMVIERIILQRNERSEFIYCVALLLCNSMRSKM